MRLPKLALVAALAAEDPSRDVLPRPLSTARWNGKLYAATKHAELRDRLTDAPNSRDTTP